MNDTDLNLNSTECLVTKFEIGHDVIHNICTGEKQLIEWGVGDWMLLGLAGCASLLIVILILLLIAMIVTMVREHFGYY